MQFNGLGLSLKFPTCLNFFGTNFIYLVQIFCLLSHHLKFTKNIRKWLFGMFMNNNLQYFPNLFIECVTDISVHRSKTGRNLGKANTEHDSHVIFSSWCLLTLSKMNLWFMVFCNISRPGFGHDMGMCQTGYLGKENLQRELHL